MEVKVELLLFCMCTLRIIWYLEKYSDANNSINSDIKHDLFYLYLYT